MNTYTDKKNENKSRKGANIISQNKNSGVSTFQFVDNRPEAIVQQKQIDAIQNTSKSQTIQKKENKTGLPDNLKSGIENLSGIDMSDTKVHYNSNKPAQLNAHAYAQGTDIHLASGQEKHLPHEAWHVVQQKQGRVKPTLQMKGKANINDDTGLEQEADKMGEIANNLSNKNAQQNTLLELFNSKDTHARPVLQGYFVKGYNPIAHLELIKVFNELLSIEGSNLKEHEGTFYNMLFDKNDKGGFDAWLKTVVEPGDLLERMLVIVKEAGVDEGNFRGAMREVGALNIRPPEEAIGMLGETEALKDEEERAELLQPPPSPRLQSRIIQIPTLIGLIQRCFNANELLQEFEYILGGGSAMSLKRPRGGRLGRASENMRDIDMDFQFKVGRAPIVKAILDRDEVTTKKGMMELIMNQMDTALDTLPGGALRGLLKTEDMRISGRNTIMFNAGDLEYSFHFVDEGEENERRLNFNEETVSGDLGNIRIIRDDSHWLLTKYALRARLKRPDKIHKTLIDACIFIGTPEQQSHARRLQETAAILFGGFRNINTSRNTLRRLAGPDVMKKDRPDEVEHKGQPISGLKPQLALEWRQFLLGKTPRLYDKTVKERLEADEMIEVRNDYFVLFQQILSSIIQKAGSERPVVRDNATKLLVEFQARYKNYSHVLHRPTIWPSQNYNDDNVLSNPLSSSARPPEDERNVIDLPPEE
ncbi:DUF4157 domain-containing protein [uncultured Winogradskyella sp.]|uniref:eCIS core domain-containing protein n=1 Tax=uncultured Winogradskyella sp. TaxID=395353 RepID=UPI0026256B00|nr:DUF4157 domain-containing protein [uncultured Winogradskyella sp.]